MIFRTFAGCTYRTCSTVIPCSLGECEAREQTRIQRVPRAIPLAKHHHAREKPWVSIGFPGMIYTWWVNSRKIFVYDRGYGLIPMTSRFLRAYLGFRPESAPADAPLLRLEPAASRFPNIYGFIPMAGYGQHWSYDLDLLPSGYLT